MKDTIILFGIFKVYYIIKRYNLEDINKNKNIIINSLRD